MSGSNGDGVGAGGEKLVYMANQIARFFESQGAMEVAVTQTMGHIKDFWSRAMQLELLAFVDSGGGAALSPIARAAIDRLRTF